MQNLSFLDQVTPMTNGFYKSAHLRWRAQSTQQQAMESWFKGWLSEHYAGREEPLRILSIGCGTGILDKVILQRLAELTDCSIDYIGVDPNPDCLADFTQRMQSLKSDRVQLSTFAGTYQQYQDEQPFDLIFGVHMLYYDEQPVALVDKAVAGLSTEGQALFLLAPAQPLSQYYVKVMRDSFAAQVVLADDLLVHLKDHAVKHQRIPAWADISSCFTRGSTADELLSFICHGDIRGLSENERSAYQQHLASICEQDQRVRHDVDAIVIPAQ